MRRSRFDITRVLAALATVFLLLAVDRAMADGVINTLVGATDGSGVGVNVQQKDLRQATQDIANSVGDYTSLAGHPFNAIYSVGGAKNVVQFTGNSARTTLTLTDPRSGFSQVFSDVNSANTIKDVDDFLKTGGLTGPFANYQRAINTESSLGVTDGNPLAATAVFANDAFTQFGFNPAVSQASKMATGSFQVGLTGGFGAYHAFDANGKYVDADLNLGLRFTDHVALVCSIPFEWRSVGGSNTWITGVNLGVPITILHHGYQDDGLAWQVSPWVTVGGGLNGAILAGGGMYGGGATSALSYEIDQFTFTLANQIGYDAGFSIQIGDNKYNDPVNQWITKNGLEADYSFCQWCYANVSLTGTNFLATAAIAAYITPMAGVGFRFGQQDMADLRVNYVGNFGTTNYQDNGIQLLLRARF
jgi:hypothetical protein